MIEERTSSSTSVLHTGALSAEETEDKRSSSSFATRSLFFDPGLVSWCFPANQSATFPVLGVGMDGTSNGLDHLPSNATFGRVYEFQSNLTEISEIRAALDDKNISVVFLSAQDLLFQVIAFPGSDAPRDVVQMIVTAKYYVCAMDVLYGLALLGGGRQCVDALGEFDVL